MVEILDLLCNQNIFSINLEEGKKVVRFHEEYGFHYWLELNKSQMLKLIEELSDIAERMIE